MAATSTTVPSTFDMWVTATSFVRGPMASSTRSGSSEPSGSMSTHFSTTPCRSRRKCQGTMLAWCSITESTISSPSFEPRRRPGVADEVDAHRRAGGEDDLLRAPGAEEAGDGGPRRLVLLGREVREIVQAAVDVGVLLGIGPRHRVDHRLRLLRRGAVVEIDQRPSVHLAREDRKVAANRVDVVHQPASRGVSPRIASSIAVAKNSMIPVSTVAPSTITGLRKPCSSAMKLA